MSKNMSPKDVAFEKERAKYRKQIREIEYENKQLLLEIHSLKETIDKKDEEILKLSDWIERLLEYTELSEEDMKKIIQQEKAKQDSIDSFSQIFKLFNRFGSVYL